MNAFERILLSLTVAASMSLWGAWAAAAPVDVYDIPADLDRAERCDSLANLHYAMAESAGVDADAAWEDAYAVCTAEGSVIP